MNLAQDWAHKGTARQANVLYVVCAVSGLKKKNENTLSSFWVNNVTNSIPRLKIYSSINIFFS